MNFDKREKIFMELIKSSLIYFNEKGKAKLTAEFYVSNGNVARISKNGKVLLSDISIENAYYAVAAIARYMEVR